MSEGFKGLMWLQILDPPHEVLKLRSEGRRKNSDVGYVYTSHLLLVELRLRAFARELSSLYVYSKQHD